MTTVTATEASVPTAIVAAYTPSHTRGPTLGSLPRMAWNTSSARQDSAPYSALLNSTFNGACRR